VTCTVTTGPTDSLVTASLAVSVGVASLDADEDERGVVPMTNFVDVMCIVTTDATGSLVTTSIVDVWLGATGEGVVG
jgi:hypothetical protein